MHGSPSPSVARPLATPSDRQRVLVADPIADRGLETLRRHHALEIGIDWSPEELCDRIGAYDGLLVRSGTQVTADLIDRGEALKVIGRAGVGTDNIDLEAATRRGIVVANAPESTVGAAAEHTIAMLMALARHIPQAHAALRQGEWARSRFVGVQVEEKVLGLLGFGRIGQLVAAKAQGLGMKVMAHDPFVPSERFEAAGVEPCGTPEELYRSCDFLSIHLPKSELTAGMVDRGAMGVMKPGIRIVNCARGGILDEQALQGALKSGRVAGAALDVFAAEPPDRHPLFGFENVVVTPHLGASTDEAQDRAGEQAAREIIAALSGELPRHAVNLPTSSMGSTATNRTHLDARLALAERLGLLAGALTHSRSLDRIEIVLGGHWRESEVDLAAPAALVGLLGDRNEDPVNLVNALTLARERRIGIDVSMPVGASSSAPTFSISLLSDGPELTIEGKLPGLKATPRLTRLWGQSFDLELADRMTFFRYLDQPGMLGRIGARFGDAGINIASAVVGRQPDRQGSRQMAAIALTTEDPVPPDLMDEILVEPHFDDGYAVHLPRPREL